VYHGTSGTTDTLGTKKARKSLFLVLKSSILESKKYQKALFLAQKQGFLT